MRFIEYLSGPNPVTVTAAGGAATSPFWLEWLRQVSDVAAVLLPILGVVWLVIQMCAFFRKHK